ncbi:MAG: hypothetical protein ACYCWE_19760 [Eubacteriales bacterium]
MMTSHFMIGETEYIIEYKPELCLVKCFSKKVSRPLYIGTMDGCINYIHVLKKGYEESLIKTEG